VNTDAVAEAASVSGEVQTTGEDATDDAVATSGAELASDNEKVSEVSELAHAAVTVIAEADTDCIGSTASGSENFGRVDGITREVNGVENSGSGSHICSSSNLTRFSTAAASGDEEGDGGEWWTIV